MARYRYYNDFFPRSKPRQAKGGIKAQSKRGSFGESWWAKRWIETLESFHIGARLTRGRTYARKGQVLSIDIEPGEVKAKVQGSRSTPYGVTIGLAPLSSENWDALLQAFSSQAIFVAKLLAGEMPPEVEEVFTEQKLSLFPKKHSDLQTNCSCPDYSNPCKHIAAVYYLLAEEFDRDPFLIFRLRGMTREEMLERLGAAAPPSESAQGSATEDAPEEALEENTLTAPPEPLPVDVAEFWRGHPLPEDAYGEVSRPRVSAAIPKRLGAFPFWRGRDSFIDQLESIYRDASAAGLDVFLKDRETK